MKRISILALLAIMWGIAAGDPVPPPGLRQVTHDGTLTGTGTSANPLSVVAGGGAPLMALTTGTVSTGKIVAGANKAVVQVTNVTGTDSYDQLIDLGVTPSNSQLVVISVTQASNAGYAFLTGGIPSGTSYPILGNSSVAGPGQSGWFVFNGTGWVPLYSALPSGSIELTNSLIAGGSLLADGNVIANQLVEGGATRVQATILTTSIGTNATVDLDVTGEGVTERLFANAQTSAGSISKIINSFSTPIGGQSLEFVNSSAYTVTLNGSSGGTGQIKFPTGLASLPVSPGQTVLMDYDSGNELGFGSNVWVVLGWTGTSPSTVTTTAALTATYLPVATGAETIANSSLSEASGYFGIPGKFLFNESTGDVNTVGAVTASGQLTSGQNFSASGTVIVYSGTAASSGNASINITAGGTGSVNINGNAGGLANGGTGGLIVYGGANGSTPEVTLAANGAVTAASATFTAGLNVSSSGATVGGNVSTSGHIVTTGGTPSITSGCGTSPTAPTGSDQWFYFTTGTSPGTCIITFSAAWPHAPICLANNETTSGTSLPLISASTTALTLTSTGASTKYNIMCGGY